jgi:hypothetical protein
MNSVNNPSPIIMAPVEWATLQRLVEQSAYPPERLLALKRQLTTPPGHAEGWLTLLAGQPSIIDLLIGRWLTPDLLAGMNDAEGQPVVLGRRPESIQPGAPGLVRLKAKQPAGGHLIVVRASGAMSPTVRTQLAAMGIFDQVVVVTRLGQPLPASECQLIRSLVGYAAAVRVLVVGLPGEEASDADFADLLAYGKARAQSNGYSYRQYAGLSLWYTSSVKTPSTLADPATIMAPPAEVKEARTLAARQALSAFLDELCRHIERTAPKPTAIPLSEEEVMRLHRELTGYLASLGRTLERDLEQHPAWRSADLHARVQRALTSWTQPAQVEYMWLRYLERVRPGVWAALLQAAESSFPRLQVHAEESVQVQPVAPAPVAWQARLLLEAKRGAVGLAVGIAAYLAASVLFATTPLIRETVAPPVAMLLSLLILAVMLALGYGLGRRLIQPAQTAPQVTVTQRVSLTGWSEVTESLLAALTVELRPKQLSLRDECNRLANLYRAEEN